MKSSENKKARDSYGIITEPTKNVVNLLITEINHVYMIPVDTKAQTYYWKSYITMG